MTTAAINFSRPRIYDLIDGAYIRCMTVSTISFAAAFISFHTKCGMYRAVGSGGLIYLPSRHVRRQPRVRQMALRGTHRESVTSHGGRFRLSRRNMYTCGRGGARESTRGTLSDWRMDGLSSAAGRDTATGLASGMSTVPR